MYFIICFKLVKFSLHIYEFALGKQFSFHLLQLVTHGNTRNEALDIMNKALDSYVIRGTMALKVLHLCEKVFS